MNMPAKILGHTRPKARQLIINDMIDKARDEVIKSDIEIGFHKRVIEKFTALKIDKIFSKSEIEKTLNAQQNNYNFYLEKLNYLKELREIEKNNKMDKLIQSIENTTPDTISVIVQP